MALVACAPRIYHKPGMTQASFNADSAQCQMQAQFLPQQYTPPPPTTYSAYTSIYGNRAYTTIQPNANPGAGLVALGDALVNIAARESFLHNCMMSKGYVEVQQTAGYTAPSINSGTSETNIQTLTLRKKEAPQLASFVETARKERKTRYNIDVKSEATFDSTTIASLKIGEVITVRRSNNIWHFVETTSGVTGYVADDWLTAE